MTIRYLFLISHRWLGIATAVVLSIVGLTGAILVWQDHPRFLRIFSFAEPLHVDLKLGALGGYAVFYSTVLSVPLAVGGVVLWWKRKIVRLDRRFGLRRILADLHHALGVVGFLLMLLLSVTGIGMTTVPRDSPWRQPVAILHTTRGYPTPIKVIYALATTAFFVQSVTGLVMWWKPSSKKA